MEYSINSDIAETLGELDQNGLELLEKNIQRDQMRDNIVIAEIEDSGERYILDGVHRYMTCQKLGIEIPEDKFTPMRFPTTEAAEEWAFDNQLGRRNLPPSRRCAIGLRWHVKYAEEGKRRMAEGNAGSDSESEPWDSYAEVAKRVGVGPVTYKKYCRIAHEHQEELAAIHIGEETITGTYKRLYEDSDPDEQAQPDTTVAAANPEGAPERAPGPDVTPPSESSTETTESTSEQADPAEGHEAPAPVEDPAEEVQKTRADKDETETGIASPNDPPPSEGSHAPADTKGSAPQSSPKKRSTSGLRPEMRMSHLEEHGWFIVKTEKELREKFRKHPGLGTIIPVLLVENCEDIMFIIFAQEIRHKVQFVKCEEDEIPNFVKWLLDTHKALSV